MQAPGTLAGRHGTRKIRLPRKNLEPLRYDGENGVRAILEHLSAFGWEKVMEGDNLVALTHSDGGSITLEPAGQLELSGAPLETIHQTCEEVSTHLNL